MFIGKTANPTVIAIIKAFNILELYALSNKAEVGVECQSTTNIAPIAYE